MKEHPILFSVPMLRAIREGRKTQTRRLVKPAPGYIESSGRWKWPMPKRLLKQYPNCGHVYTASREWWQYLPKEAFPVQTGDVLWVRETGWERPFRSERDMREGADTWERYYYDADGLTAADHEEFRRWGFKRRPSIHMPKWASRFRLPVKSVRVERLQDISEEGARAEGIWQDGRTAGSVYPPRVEFYNLWESIHGRDSWDVNPWVWVYEWEPVR